MFGRKRGQQQTRTADDESIPDDLLNAIPDLDAQAEAPAAEEEIQTLEVDVAPPSVEVHALLGDVRREMESLFTKELDRVEASFDSLVKQMETRLRAATQQVALLEAERAALEQANAAYERKFQALKSITHDLG